MSSPDLIVAERLEELLRGALPEGEREARVEGLARELRAAPLPPPEGLRTRVRALRAPRARGLRLTRRGALVAVAVAGIASLLGASAVVGGRSWLNGGAGQSESAAQGEPAPFRQAERALPPQVGESLREQSRASVPFSALPRARDVDMWIELRVRDADGLSDAANDAMRITRELGGYVASSSVGTEGKEGRAELALRVPVGQVEEAVVRLSELGTITGQRTATRDLQGGIDRVSARITTLERAMRIAKLELASGTLDAEEHLRLQIRLERLRGELEGLRKTRVHLLREASTAELTFVLHTRPAAAGREEESRVAGAAHDAVDFLGRAGSVAVFSAIVLSPLGLLLVLAGLAFRARSRRIEAELLAQSHARQGRPGTAA